jgi:adenosine deaminase
MGYFLYRIVRSARIFEQTSLLELRFTPYLRTDPSLDGPQRIAAMGEVVEAIGGAEGPRIRRGRAARAVPPYAVVRRD